MNDEMTAGIPRHYPLLWTHGCIELYMYFSGSLFLSFSLRGGAMEQDCGTSTGMLVLTATHVQVRHDGLGRQVYEHPTGRIGAAVDQRRGQRPPFEWRT